MKDVVVLLWLLSVHTSQVCSRAYEADSNGNCMNPETHFKLEETNLCCSKCKPGHRLKKECTMDADTLCELCPRNQYLEQRNYSPNCIACITCKPGKGLIYLRNCSSTTNSRCGCQPGMYCIIGFNDPYCAYCTRYTTCKAGFGVDVPGTANNDVRCQACPNGTFSNTVSHLDRCQPHTKCEGRAVVRQGNAEVDTVCEPSTVVSHIKPQTTTEKPRQEIRLTTKSPTTMAKDLLPESTTNFSSSVTLPPRETKSDSEEVFPPVLVAIGGGFAALVFVIAIVLLIGWKRAPGKDPANPSKKIDANGNCDDRDKMSEDSFKETTLISYTQERERLLKEAEACSSQSQSSNSTDLLTRSDDCSSFESIGPSQSTAALHGPHSTALSEPMPLRSHRESVPSQTSVPAQPPSQPTSPHVISPIATSPHVNVNITFNIGNGSEKTQCVTPTSLVQSDCHLQFGEEEETFSIPQQEAGKEAVVTVQESTVCCT